jgi:Family of unknown function (DUF5681)
MTKKAPLQRAVGKRLPDGACGRRSTDCSAASQPAASDAEYKVGPGRPPREYRFKPGKSGNPKGAKPKPPSIAPDLKLALERALNKTVKLKQGEKERIVTMAEAGIEQLVAQFAKGDRHARRDLIALADKLGVDLLAGQHKRVQEALASNHQAILETYVARQYDKVRTPSPVIAPPELLDDDPQDTLRCSTIS